MKFNKVWMLGGDKKAEMDFGEGDYVRYYVADNGMIIECEHAFSNFNDRWYTVYTDLKAMDNGQYLESFDTLKEAKAFCMNYQR